MPTIYLSSIVILTTQDTNMYLGEQKIKRFIRDTVKQQQQQQQQDQQQHQQHSPGQPSHPCCSNSSFGAKRPRSNHSSGGFLFPARPGQFLPARLAGPAFFGGRGWPAPAPAPATPAPATPAPATPAPATPAPQHQHQQQRQQTVPSGPPLPGTTTNVHAH
ncbi:hypothetical protein N656DRAFT_396276 [Canariomyces notabilis]|uniref:Uncharacterized protein n=1 Tax=Canariomyces notabilis TaxID=2074819 RepID=A0AAN6TK07_9PEZI|nr:hypothetical protein N656DRAFT_396276 [Canariomyces arenarius]